MPLDWFVSWVISPVGFVVIGVFLLLPLYFWPAFLGHAALRFSRRPLLVAYACALTGLICLDFFSTYSMFSARVALGAFTEAQRWSVVPLWMIPMAVLYVSVALPLLGLIGMPLAALLLRRTWLGYRNIAFVLLLLWLVAAVPLLALLSGDSPQSHAADLYFDGLMATWPGILLVAAPFFLGLKMAAGIRPIRGREVSH